MSEPRKLPFTGRFLVRMANGTDWEIEPSGWEIDSGLHGPMIQARFRKPDGTWDEGNFRRDLIVSMEPLLDAEAA